MLLQGQRFVVTGIASKLSIAWSIAEALHREGASLILTYPNEKIKKSRLIWISDWLANRFYS